MAANAAFSDVCEEMDFFLDFHWPPQSNVFVSAWRMISEKAWLFSDPSFQDAGAETSAAALCLGRSDCGPCVRRRSTRIEGWRTEAAGLCALALAQVRERHEMHIVCVHLNKDKCQISMAPGCLHVR